MVDALVYTANLWIFAAGILLGIWLTNLKWRSNADQIQRLESGGYLYKVYRLGFDQDQLFPDEYSTACNQKKHG